MIAGAGFQTRPQVPPKLEALGATYKHLQDVRTDFFAF